MMRMSCGNWTIMKFFDMMVMKMMMAVMMIMVVMAVITKVMMVIMMNLLQIERQNFVLPQLPLFIPEPEAPTPNDRIPVEYVNMFLTDYMIGNLVLESNKCGTEKTGHVQTLPKQSFKHTFESSTSWVLLDRQRLMTTGGLIYIMSKLQTRCLATCRLIYRIDLVDMM